MLENLITTSSHEWSPRSFLANLNSSQLETFTGAGRFQQFGSGELLIEEGGSDTSVHILLNPAVKITAAMPDGGEALLAVRVAGDIVGELAALDGQPRLASVRSCARGELDVLTLPGPTFRELLAKDGPVALWLSNSVSAKLRAATRRRIDYTGFDSHVRLARVLLELAEDHGYRPRSKELVIGVNLTQVELGTLVGVAEATAQRGLRRLREEGLVLTDGRRPIIRDLEGLQQVAGQV
ncbi:Crp/Fnr family transcriptional regulator [Kineosporia babensis]|uniref:Crp/Fnr family transcriptional regulator n=1 Tax=Kineosporia babensis TaxID=499548 RepID=A0A9X1SUY3_9ACTN|nr:Crp/Fnr family transcriptional regulator [Kineosporia babensis]MCD5313269.1 Crp/Fnr family transcriptional regulator [Kineosporia babensis]